LCKVEVRFHPRFLNVGLSLKCYLLVVPCLVSFFGSTCTSVPVLAAEVGRIAKTMAPKRGVAQWKFWKG